MKRIPCLSLMFILMALPAYAAVSLSLNTNSTESSFQQTAIQSYGKLPLSFEANQGQVDPKVKFLSRGKGYNLYLTSTEAVLVLQKRGVIEDQSAQKIAEPVQESILRMKLVGANPHSKVKGQDILPGKGNYFIGQDPSKWRTDIPTYAKVRYEGVYPGVDLIYYGNQRQLEYDFVVAPGADPKTIELAFQGAERLQIKEEGDLLLQVKGEEVRLRKPVIYQEINNLRQPIAGRYFLKGKNKVGFRISDYDIMKPLIIDPVLSYSTYLGGQGGDMGSGIVVDAAGNAYVTGNTASIDFPSTSGAYQPALGGGACQLTPDFAPPCDDIFVAKLNATGSALIYSTYIGGDNQERGRSIAIDASGNAYITGETQSMNFPITPGAFQKGLISANCGSSAQSRPCSDGFVVKLNPTGSALVYSTYLGGNGDDISTGIAIDSAGNTYLSGITSSTNFPLVNPIQPKYSGGVDGFVAKLNAAGSALVYSTYLGGSDHDGASDITIDSSANAYVVGGTFSKDFPIVNPLQAKNHGTSNAFVSKIDPTGGTLIFSTYLGGGNFDQASSVAADASGNIYLAGSSNSIDFPVVNPIQATNHGGNDAFIAKMNPAGSALIYSTYLGGSGNDGAGAVTIDRFGNVYLTGDTTSLDFPTIHPIQSSSTCTPQFPFCTDVFIAKINAPGTSLSYSTYLGGVGTNVGFSIAVDATGNAYITGYTDALDYPTTAGAFQPTSSASNGDDVFITKIGNVSPVAQISANPSSGAPPLAVHFDGSASSDPDGTIGAYTWDFGDGSSGTGPTADHTYASAGSFTATLTVTDDAGAKGSSSTQIRVSNTLFSDDFNRVTGLGSNWKVYAGSFTTDGSSAVSTGATNFAGITSLLGASDYTVESVLTVPAGSLYSGIIARANPSSFTSDLYAAQISTAGSVNLYRRNAGSWTQLESASSGIAAGTPYTLRLKVSGSNPVTLEVALNGSILFAYQDSSASRILSGIPGIENYNSGVKYDRFIVSSIASSAPPRLQSIAVSPVNPTITVGATQAFTARGSFSDGSTKDLTTSVTWSSGNTAVATISNQAGSQGVAKGISAGSATISAVDPATSISGGTILTVTAGNQAPIARLSANPTSGVAPLVVHFDGSGSSDPDGTITSYAWSFGDGVGGTGVTSDHTYSAAGTYTATLTVTDNQGAKGSTQTTITVSPQSSNILFNDDFSRNTGLGSNWQVYFGSFTTDGNFAISQNTVANWAAVTQALNTNDYTVESVLTIPAGSLYSGIVARGNLSTGFYKDLYAAQIAADGTVNLYRRNAGSWTQLKSAQAGIVAGTSYTLKLKVAGRNPVNLEVLLNGSSLFTYQDSSASQIFSGVPGIENYNPGVKYDRFTVSSNSTTSINKPPTAKITTDATSGLAPLTVHFDGSTSSDPDGSIASYLWNFGDGSTGTTSIMSHTYNQAGTFTASLTVTDNNGATGTAQVTITVTAPGTPTLFSDGFNRTTGLGSNWQVYYGSFTTDGSNAVSQGTVANWAAITPSLNTDDYSVEAVLTVPAGSVYSGVVARGNPGTGFLKDLYAAQIATDGTVNLYRRNAGSWTQLKSASAGIAAGISYTLKLKVSGTNPVNLEVYLNGSVLFTFSDTSTSRILSGIPGIENYNNGVKYDRFTVTSP